MKKLIIACLIGFILPSRAKSQMLDSIMIYKDTVCVDYIVFADSITGILMKKNKQIVVRRTAIKKVPPFYLAEVDDDVELFDRDKKRIDWIIYKIGNTVYSVTGQGNLSKMFFRNEDFHNAP
jgi:hypothetical protein